MNHSTKLQISTKTERLSGILKYLSLENSQIGYLGEFRRFLRSFLGGFVDSREIRKASKSLW